MAAEFEGRTALFRLSQLAARAMANQGKGVIVNIASIDAYGTDGTFASYCASKPRSSH